MPDPRQIPDLPVAVSVADADLLLVRQGLFDRQAEASLIRAGLLVASNNLSDITDAAAARNNLGIDTSDFLVSANNLDDLGNVASARANLDVPSTSEALLVSNNLSDLANAATARANLDVAQSTITAVKTSTNDFNFNIQDKMRIRNYSEVSNAAGDIGTTHSFNLATANVHTATVDDDVTISFTNPPTSGQSGSVFLILTDGGNHAVTWPGSVLWPGGSAPALTTDGTDLLVFTTVDGGTTWYGALAGADLS